MIYGGGARTAGRRKVKLRPVVAVDVYVFAGEITAEYGGAPGAAVEVDDEVDGGGLGGVGASTEGVPLAGAEVGGGLFFNSRVCVYGLVAVQERRPEVNGHCAEVQGSGGLEAAHAGCEAAAVGVVAGDCCGA